jgi:hypothetical protein
MTFLRKTLAPDFNRLSGPKSNAIRDSVANPSPVKSLSMQVSVASAQKPVSRLVKATPNPEDYSGNIIRRRGLPLRSSRRGDGLEVVPPLIGEMTGIKVMRIVPLPYAVGTVPPLFDFRERTTIRGLGVASWSLFSHALTVGGIFRFDMPISSSTFDCRSTVWAIRLSIVQHIAVTSPRRKAEGPKDGLSTTTILFTKGSLPTAERQLRWYGVLQGPKVQTRGDVGPLWEGSEVPFETTSRDPEFAVMELARLPNEDRLRPTTLLG